VPRLIATVALLFAALPAPAQAAAEWPIDWAVLYWLPEGDNDEVVDSLTGALQSERLALLVVQARHGDLERDLVWSPSGAYPFTPAYDNASLHRELAWLARTFPARRYLVVAPPIRWGPPCPSPQEWTPVPGWHRGVFWPVTETAAELLVLRDCQGAGASADGLFLPLLKRLARQPERDSRDLLRLLERGIGGRDGAGFQYYANDGSLLAQGEVGSEEPTEPEEPPVAAVIAAAPPIAEPIVEPPERAEPIRQEDGTGPLRALLVGLALALVATLIGLRGEREAEDDEEDAPAAEALRVLARGPIDDPAVEQLRWALRSLRPPLVAAAVYAVVVAPAPALLPELARLPRLTAPAVLLQAGAAVLGSGESRGQRMLLWVVAGGDAAQATTALEVLGRHGTPSATRPLTALARRRLREETLDAIDAIRARHGDEHVGGLSLESAKVREAMGSLSFESPEVREAIGSLMLASDETLEAVGRLSLEEREGELSLAP
jgi:hypothetical protein